MLKQSLSRNQRSKGCKVKHVLQMCLLVAISIWLLYHVKQFYDKKAAPEETSKQEVKHVKQDRTEIPKLGRKDLDPRQQERVIVSREHRDDEGEEEELEQEDDERTEVDLDTDGDEQAKVEADEAEQLEDLIDEDDSEEKVNESTFSRLDDSLQHPNASTKAV